VQGSAYDVSRSAGERTVYELPLAGSGTGAPEAAKPGAAPYLSEGLLVRSALWFCSLRWIVVVILVAFGFLDLFPTLLPRIGLRAQRQWPFTAAAVLAVANLGFLWHARHLARSEDAHGTKANLWAQIVVDLAVLTVVVHFMGSLETYVGFAYLFHIVLSCIFFPRSWSLAVTGIACSLYVACVALEETGVLDIAGIYADPTLRARMGQVPGATLLNVTWAAVTWVVVWYVTSHLSAMVRQRDADLARTNRRLTEAQKEKMQHMLRTTHELKAPFAAIDANIQTLLKGYCGPLPSEAHGVVVRLGTRCRRLATQIQEMLQLANLQSAREEPLDTVEADLAEVLRWCVAQAQPIADDRGVALAADLQSARAVAVKDHLRMLFTNLLSNAVHFSHRGGRVGVQCSPGADGGAVVVVEDQGIGIPPNKIPRIFDAYYRTEEGVRHCKESTGLGLAIVRRVAEVHRIRVRVESAPGRGTKFTLVFPSAETPVTQAEEREDVADGLSADRGR